MTLVVCVLVHFAAVFPRFLPSLGLQVVTGEGFLAIRIASMSDTLVLWHSDSVNPKPFRSRYSKRRCTVQNTMTRIAFLFAALTVLASPSFGQSLRNLTSLKQLSTGKAISRKVAPSKSFRAPQLSTPKFTTPQTFRPQASKPKPSTPQFRGTPSRPSFVPQFSKPRVDNFRRYDPGQVTKPAPRQPSIPGLIGEINRLPGRVRVPGQVTKPDFTRNPGQTFRPLPGQVYKPAPGSVYKPAPSQIGRTPVPSVPGNVRVPGLKTPNPTTPGIIKVPEVARVPGPKLTPGNASDLGDKLADRIPGVRKPFPGFDKLGKDGPTKLDNVGRLDGLTKFAGLADQLGDKLGKDNFKPIAPEKLRKNFGDIFKDGGVKKHAPKEFSEAKSLAIRRLDLRPHCHWWVDFLSDCHWGWHGCYWWDYCHVPDYWSCWTPCHYHVVYCPATPSYVARSWYFGVECILVPDMAAYGIQEVYEGSPAAMAGLLPGDLIVSVNQVSISDESVLANNIQTSNGVIELGIVRDGSEEPFFVDVAMELVQSIVQ